MAATKSATEQTKQVAQHVAAVAQVTRDGADRRTELAADRARNVRPGRPGRAMLAQKQAGCCGGIPLRKRTGSYQSVAAGRAALAPSRTGPCSVRGGGSGRNNSGTGGTQPRMPGLRRLTAIQRTPSTALVCPRSVLPRLRINFLVDKLTLLNLVDRFKYEKLTISAQDLLLIRTIILLSNMHLSRDKYLLLCISPD
ncbi:hypothetical protein [Methylobacterium sp. CM6257]